MGRIKFLLSLFLMLFTIVVHGQLYPYQNAILHYRVVGFKDKPIRPRVKSYILEVAKGDVQAGPLFDNNILFKQTSKQREIVAEVPEWGALYSWRINELYEDGVLLYGEIWKFNTGMFPGIDTNSMRMRIIKDNGKYKNAYFMVDSRRGIFNAKGQLIWILPSIDGLQSDKMTVFRDLKTTRDSTMTFINIEDAIELTYQGKILWKGPTTEAVGGPKKSKYHHELTKLNKNKYLVMTGKNCYFYKTDDVANPTIKQVSESDFMQNQNVNGYFQVQFSGLEMIDSNGNIVWQWNSIDHFDLQKLYTRKAPYANSNLDMHGNAFYFDEKNSCIYVSFKTMSQIVKVHYPDGKVMATYSGTSDKLLGKNMFCHQHCCRLNSNQEIMVLNNNACDSLHMPSVVMMKPVGNTGAVTKVWEMVLPTACPDSLALKIRDKSHFGTVTELPDHNYFVTISGPYSDMYIISRKKEILWHAIVEKYNIANNIWESASTYRASMIWDKKAMEALIWK